MNAFTVSARKALVDFDMTVTDLAKAINRDRSYVNRVLTGTMYSKPIIERIADYLEISTDGWNTPVQPKQHIDLIEQEQLERESYRKVREALESLMLPEDRIKHQEQESARLTEDLVETLQNLVGKDLVEDEPEEQEQPSWVSMVNRK